MPRPTSLLAGAALSAAAVIASPAFAQAPAEERPYVVETRWPDWVPGKSRFALVDRSGRVLFSADPEHVLDESATPLSQRRVLEFRLRRDPEKHGLLDATGMVVLPPIYREVTVYAPKRVDAGAFAYVATDGSSGHCIEAAAKPLIAPKPGHEIGCPREGLARVRGPVDAASGKRLVGYMDAKGEVAIPLRYEVAYAFAAGTAQVKVAGKWGLIDRGGNLVVPAEHDEMSRLSPDSNLLRVRKGRLWGLIDDTGKAVVPVEHADISSSPPSDGRLAAKSGTLWGYLDPATGGFAIQPAFSSANRFSGGLAVVARSGKRGVIDRDGKVVIPVQYDSIQRAAGLFEASGRSASGERFSQIYDAKGKEIPMPELTRFAVRTIDPSGMIWVSDSWMSSFGADGVVGLADASGKLLVEPVFTSIRYFRDGIAVVQRQSRLGPFAIGAEYGLLDRAGKFTLVPGLGGTFGPHFGYDGPVEGGTRRGEVAFAAAVPGMAAAWALTASTFKSSWFGMLLGLAVFPLLFAFWWVGAWRVAMRVVANVEVPYGRVWRSMLGWIAFTALYGLALASMTKQVFSGFLESLGDTWAGPVIVFVIAIPVLYGIFPAGAQVRQPGARFRPWIASVLTLVGFVGLSSAPFFFAALSTDWMYSYWTPAVLIALAVLSVALRKREADSRTLKELALAGFAGWCAVMLWVLASNLYGAYI